MKEKKKHGETNQQIVASWISVCSACSSLLIYARLRAQKIEKIWETVLLIFATVLIFQKERRVIDKIFSLWNHDIVHIMASSS